MLCSSVFLVLLNEAQYLPLCAMKSWICQQTWFYTTITIFFLFIFGIFFYFFSQFLYLCQLNGRSCFLVNNVQWYVNICVVFRCFFFNQFKSALYWTNRCCISKIDGQCHLQQQQQQHSNVAWILHLLLYFICSDPNLIRTQTHE